MRVTVRTTPPIVMTRPGRLLGVGAVHGKLSPGAENTTSSVSLDNGDGYFSRLWAVPPLGFEVAIEHGGEVVFSGAVTRCSLSAVCELECES